MAAGGYPGYIDGKFKGRLNRNILWRLIHLNMNITKLSLQYTVRKMTADDVGGIYELSSGNPMFYQYCPPFVTEESILEDMKALPPGITCENKYYIGFFEETRLVAVMDLILNYPDTQTSFIGFFMVSRAEQGKGIGSRIVKECFCYLRSRNYRFIRLGFAKGNPQSEAFWKKNGFAETGIETDNGSYTVVVLQKNLQADVTEKEEQGRITAAGPAAH